MKISKVYLLSSVLACMLGSAPAAAQTGITGSENPIIVPISPTRTVTSRATFGTYKVAASVDFTVSSDATWCEVEKTNKGFSYSIAQNTDKGARKANITISNGDNSITRTVTIIQEASQLEKYVTTPTLTVKAKSGTDANGNSLAKTIDGYTSTYYTYTSPAGTINESNPLILDYTFAGEHIDYIKYNPNDTANGYMGKAKVYYKKLGSDEFTELGTYDLGTDASSILLGNGGADNVSVLRIAVWDGAPADADEKFGCAEMQFQKSLNNTTDYNVFADELLTKLRPDVTEEDISNISNLYVQDLASQIYNGTYDTKFRVGKYPCILPPKAAADTLLTGKWYDRFEGVTGILINPGTFSVVVSGAPQGITPQLYIAAYNPAPGESVTYQTYNIKNGMNLISYTADSVGLAYVVYNSNNHDKYDSLGVHFVNGAQNGYATNKMSNDSIEKLIKNARYKCFDMVGDRVHLVFEGASILKKAAGRYRQLINIYDTIMIWQHRFLGLDKYNRVPKNRALFYVNYTYFMFQSHLGASAKNDVIDVLAPTDFLNKNTTTVWGCAHEWGHMQQSDYYTFAGFGEVSNNYQSANTLIHFGEKTNGFFAEFDSSYDEYFVNDYFAEHDSISPNRQSAYRAAGNYDYSLKLKAAFLAMENAKIPSRAEDEVHSANYMEHTACKASNWGASFTSNCLASMVRIWYYYEKELNNREMTADLFQSIRQTERGTNKYELIAASQKGVSGRLDILKEKYPESVWVQNNYVYENSTASHNTIPFILNFIYKLSTVTGYNWTPYFEKWGYLRQIATCVDDYGNDYYCLTEDMYNEFKADMDARVTSGELKEMSDALVKKIASYPMPIPNTFPVLEVDN